MFYTLKGIIIWFDFERKMEMSVTVKSFSTRGSGRSCLLLFLFCTNMLLLQGCNVGPNYVKPEVEIPDQWHQKIAEGLSEGTVVSRKWWENFNDPALTKLIETAAKSNLDVRQALLRIRQARSAFNISTGQYFPDIDVVGNYTRERASKNGLQIPLRGGDPDQTNLYNIGFDASWEIDLFGRISRSVESADASYAATIEDYHDVLVSLYAEIAANYTELRSLQSRIRYALDNINTQKETLKLTENRFDAELVPKLDVSQAKLNLANTESFVPGLRSLESQTIYRLAVLLGRYPGSLYEELKEPAGIPSQPESVQVGIPVELLRQRPDIRRAERLLAEQVANIGVAKAELYPALSLSGTFALEATRIRELGDISSRAWRIGPTVRWNIFDGNRLRENVRLRGFIAEEFYVQYEKTVLKAFEEVESAIVAYQNEKERRDAINRSVKASIKSVNLVDGLYRSGLTDFQNVLDMQRTLSDQQDRLAESQGTVIQNLISIYKAFGGGWDVELENGIAEQTDSYADHD